jgi:uncharacterized protein
MNVIIKVVSDCNMSCVYCYERERNKKRLRMTLDNIEVIMQKLSDYYLKNNSSRINFVWHGGEPLLLGIDFFKQVILMQNRIFKNDLQWSNSLQTNLTLFDDGALKFLKEYKNDFSVGVSFDFSGKERVTRNGKSVRNTVARNMNKLYANGLPVSIVTVLTHANLKHLDEIYDFIKSNNVEVRFLWEINFPKGRANRKRTISPKEYLNALSKLIERWWNNGDAQGVIVNAMDIVNKLLGNNSGSICKYSNNCQEGNLFIMMDGAVLPCDHCFTEEYSYGNIFEQPIEEILSSPVRQHCLARSLNIREKVCKNCDVLDYCVGGCPALSVGSGRDFSDKDPLCVVNHSLIHQVKRYLGKDNFMDREGHPTKKARKAFNLQ